MSDSELADSHLEWFEKVFPKHLFKDEEREELMLYTWLAWRDSYRKINKAP